jgi:hypothetical protein
MGDSGITFSILSHVGTFAQFRLVAGGATNRRARARAPARQAEALQGSSWKSVSLCNLVPGRPACELSHLAIGMIAIGAEL